MDREEVINEVKLSGLRGRGGAGFSTGTKWEFTAKAPGEVKYVVCNADEGDPGAFMDRSILEGDPHSLVEGMTICGYSVGAEEGYIYCRAEYPLAIKRLKNAIAQAEEYGLLETVFLERILTSISISKKVPGPLSAVRKLPSWPPSKAVEENLAPTSFPSDLRTLGKTHELEQREELCQCPSDHRERGQVVQYHWYQAKSGNCHLRSHR